MRPSLVSASCRSSFQRPSCRLIEHRRLLSAINLRRSSGRSQPSTNSSYANAPVSDHRQVGRALDLFQPTPSSPGSVLFGPHGTHILLKLQEFLRAQYVQFGFQEVISPIIYKQSLWQQSGHWDHYADDMYEVVGRGARGHTHGKELGDDEKYGLKPMNCPGHCLMYSTKLRSYRDLPIRYADFSPLHRNEVSGALSGLTRVRRFHQDDGHIFCLPDQVKDEIKSCLQFLDLVYKVFGFDNYSLVLSTCPEEGYIGTTEAWDRAEAQLTEALDQSGIQWKLNSGDGAFYGPKIDILLHDHTGKAHQTATIQLDFQLPERMDLEYRSRESKLEKTGVQDASPSQVTRPVMIHRAILGSLERFFALLIERTGGRWPAWLSPRQVLLICKDAGNVDYAKYIAHTISTGELSKSDQPIPRPLGSEILSVKVDDDTSQSIGHRLREHRPLRYNFKAVIGPDEERSGHLFVDVTGVPDYETHVPTALYELKWFDLADRVCKDPTRVHMRTAQLRQLILELTRHYH